MLKSIAVTTPPTKTTYVKDEAFAVAGMVVTATYTDGTIDTTATVNNALLVVTPAVLAVTDEVATLSYTHNNVTKTVTQVITVTAA
ncbi:MAG: hypothetical protein RR382_02935 [Tannerellaceae bacterium]